jgi:hypothetical protein
MNQKRLLHGKMGVEALGKAAIPLIAKLLIWGCP